MAALHTIGRIIGVIFVLGWWACVAVSADTIHVDDDALNDPGPGDPAVSDPLEDGSLDHPFDAIQEGIDAARRGYTVFVNDGTYRGSGNRDIDTRGRLLKVLSVNGPQNCIIDCEGSESDPHRGFFIHRGESPATLIVGFTIINGYAVLDVPLQPRRGGGIYVFCACPTVLNCVFSGNHADQGGGLAVGMDGAATVTNCIFELNDANAGAAIYCGTGILTATNCTIMGNTATVGGGGVQVAESSTAAIRNSILFANQAPNGPEIRVLGPEYPSTLTVAYSDIDGGQAGVGVGSNCTLNWDEGNIDGDPLFVDPANADYHLTSDSPCINAGSNYLVASPHKDIEGLPRIDQCRADMGAHESPYMPGWFLDCNGNGKNDDCDMYEGHSGDKDKDNVPDECQSIRYVDDDAPAGGDGLSWFTAYACLQDALHAAEDPRDDINEIHVAQGMYKPDQDEAGLVTPGDREATFQLLDDLALRGGYRGAYDGSGEPPDDRDIKAFETILSGDLGDNDEPDFVNYEENSFHVTRGSGTDQTAIVEGFTIAAGNADGPATDLYGGGMVNFGGSPYLRQCSFVENLGGYGGALSNRDNSAPTLTDCVFRHNEGGLGGAMANQYDCCPLVTRCEFEANRATTGVAGIYNNHSSSPMITDCIFRGNVGVPTNPPLLVGGAIDNTWSSNSTIARCIFIANTSNAGGAIGNFHASDVLLIDCVFVANVVDGTNRHYAGGAVANHDSDPMLQNCTFIGNAARSNELVDGGAIYNSQSSPSMANCTFIGNSASGTGGGMCNIFDSAPVMTNCSFVGNSAFEHPGWGGGGGIASIFGDSQTTIVNCKFWRNWDKSNSTERAQIYGTAPVIDYSCVEGWTGALGGVGNIGDDPLYVGGPSGVWTADGTYDGATYQTTFTDANASWLEDEFAGMTLNPETDQMLQSLIVSNSATTVTVWGDFATLGTAGASYKINDYHLSPGSPCIDTGDPNFVPQPGETDMDGQMRVWDGDGVPGARVDMGSDEFGSFVFGDVNCDGAVDGFDIDAFVLVLLSVEPYDEYYAQHPECQHMLADVNKDGAIDGFDIDPFVELMLK